LCRAFAGTLQISSSEEEDLGKYECIAQNNVGTEYSQPTMLYVKGRPKLETGTVLVYSKRDQN
jgi:hypothetical protein